VLVPPDQELGQLFQTGDNTILIGVRREVLEYSAKRSIKEERKEGRIV
jgi:hypothetical protein